MKFDREELRKLSKDQLIDITLELAEKVDQLTRRIDELERAAARSAAPFSKGKGKKNKKRPGRKKGQGAFGRRKEPEIRPSDTIENVKAPLKSKICPECGEAMDIEVEVATTIDVPEEPERKITRFEVEAGVCPKCGKRVRGEHPDLPRDQHGATAHRVGDRLVGRVLAMHYHGGMSLRKAAESSGILTGIEITQSAVTQRAKKHCKTGGRLNGIYLGLCEGVREAAVVNTDDTGWRTGGKSSYLMGFFTPTLAVYQVRNRHRHEEVLEMLGEMFAGILGTDRGPSYEAEALDAKLQQKCLSHLLKNLREVEKSKQGRAKCFTRKLMKILRSGLQVWQEYRAGKIGLSRFRRRGRKLKKELDHHLRDRILSDEDNQRMLDGIGWQHDKGRVFLFLDIPEVEPTNNRAERGLRPAIIARKVSQCSKNETGARIFETMKSITATLVLRGVNVAAGLAAMMKGAPMPEGQAGR